MRIMLLASALLLTACSSAPAAPVRPTSPLQLRDRARDVIRNCAEPKPAQYGTMSSDCFTNSGDEVWLDTCGSDQQACTTTAKLSNVSGMVYAVEGDGWVAAGFKRSAVDPVAALLRG